MFHNYSAYCGHCFHVVTLSPSGACPVCGAECSAYPLLREASALYMECFDRMPIDEHFHVGMVFFRGPVEMGSPWRDMIWDAVSRIVPGNKLTSVLPYYLPKLDIVAMELKYARKASLVLHDPAFDAKSYDIGLHGLFVPWSLRGSVLLEPVFGSSVEDVLLQPRYLDILPTLHQLFLWNHLWHACVVQEFWIVPEDDPNIGMLSEGAQQILAENSRPEDPRNP